MRPFVVATQRPSEPCEWSSPESDLDAAFGEAPGRTVIVDARCMGAESWDDAIALGPTLAFRALGAAVRAGAERVIVITDWPADGLPPEGMSAHRAVAQAGAHAITSMAAKSSASVGTTVAELACQGDPFPQAFEIASSGGGRSPTDPSPEETR